MNDTQQWVNDVISKMDPGEARMFALLVVDDIHDWTAQSNQRQLRGIYNRIQKSIDDDLGRYFLRELRAGEDPEKLVAEAAAVSIAKARDWENTWYKYQERDKGGKFGRMTGAQYRAQKKALKANQKVEQISLKQQRRGGYSRTMTDDQDALITPTQRDLRALRSSTVAYNAGKWDQRADKPVRDFQERYHRTTGESGATTTMNRLEATGRAVEALGTVSTNPHVAAAGALMGIAGHYGPEAEKVIGPSMRKAAYRYRGTERRPDKELSEVQNGSAAAVLRNEGKTIQPGTKPLDNLTPPQKQYVAHDSAMKYLLGATPKAAVNGRLTAEGMKRNSRIPSAAMADLHRQSGKVTPSEGILIDADGNIAAQAVGYAEDHYLPFNLKNLGALKGGSYVRTRESGGLTSEDVYAGLMSGARSMTVVSNSGMFTLHFDDDLRGGRRYNDKAKQMVGRYEHLLDAIQSNQVANPAKKMDAKTRADIRVKVEDEIAESGLEYTDDEVDQMVDNKVKEWARKPQLSPEKEAEIEAHAQDIEANEGSAAARKYRYQARDEALQDVAGQNYRLDGEGYTAALKALKEQFPYFIDSVETVTAAKNEGGQHAILADVFSNKEDKGYVDPKYNRARAASEGYFSEAVGQPKRSAANTNYQNWSHRKKSTPSTSSSDEGGEEKPQEQTAGGSIQDRKKEVNRRQVEDQELQELKTAVKHDADQWRMANGAYVNDPENKENKSMFNIGSHPTMLKYNNLLDDDERENFLSNPNTVQALHAEMKDLLNEHGPKMNETERRKFTNADDWAKTKQGKLWSDESLSQPKAGAPMRFPNDEELLKAQNDKNVRPYLKLSTSELARKSDALRMDRRKAFIEGRSNEESILDNHIRYVERARSVKFHEERFKAGKAANEAQEPEPSEPEEQSSGLGAAPRNALGTEVSGKVVADPGDAVMYLKSSADRIRNSGYDAATQQRLLRELHEDPVADVLTLKERDYALKGPNYTPMSNS